MSEKLTDTEKKSLNAGFKDMISFNEARSSPLITSLILTINNIYLPEGYKAQFWEDYLSNELHGKIKNDWGDEEEFTVSIYILDDRMNSKFIKKENVFYRMFPAIEEMIKMIIAKIKEKEDG